jgi:hypothetical protein
MKYANNVLVGLLCLGQCRAQAQLPVLDKPFTLEYTVQTLDLRSRSAREADVKSISDGFKAHIKDGSMTQSQADDIIATYRANEFANAPKNSDIKISFDGVKLFVMETQMLTSGEGATTIALLSKDGSFDYTKGAVATQLPIISNLFIDRLPFVGPSFPFVPASQKGKFLYLRSASRDGGLFYLDGDVHSALQEGVLAVTSILEYGINHRLIRQVDLRDQVSLQGQWIAKTVNDKSFSYGIDGKSRSSVPSEERKYKLVKASDHSLSPETFDYQHYLTEGSMVQVTLADGTTRLIPYHVGTGTLSDQVRDKLDQEAIVNSRSKRSPGNAAAFGAGAILGVLTLGSLLWRYKSSR